MLVAVSRIIKNKSTKSDFRVHRVMEVDVNETRERERVLIKLFSASGVYERKCGFDTGTI